MDWALNKVLAIWLLGDWRVVAAAAVALLLVGALVAVAISRRRWAKGTRDHFV